VDRVTGSRVRGCLRARPQVQLGQDAAHVVSGGLRADEQLGRNLRVGQSPFEESEHLAFSLRQQPDLTRSRSGGDAKAA
jgi:hypothetical protein